MAKTKTYVANQTIAGGFGTFHVGDPIDDDINPDVREAWLAAGIIEESGPDAPQPRTVEPVETETVEPPETATPAAPETATRPAPERASSKPKTSGHKRLRSATDEAPQKRFEQTTT